MGLRDIAEKKNQREEGMCMGTTNERTRSQYPRDLMCGCIAEDTMILMGDGQRKRICDIRIGERIAQPDDGRPILVQNVWKGWEEELIAIRTQDGGFLQMTEEHPVRQESGFIRAGELKPGDMIYGEEGRTMTVVSVNKELYNGFVCNLDLQRDGTYVGNGYFLANGIAVGDNRM